MADKCDCTTSDTRIKLKGVGRVSLGQFCSLRKKWQIGRAKARKQKSQADANMLVYTEYLENIAWTNLSEHEKGLNTTGGDPSKLTLHQSKSQPMLDTKCSV